MSHVCRQLIRVIPNICISFDTLCGERPSLPGYDAHLTRTNNSMEIRVCLSVGKKLTIILFDRWEHFQFSSNNFGVFGWYCRKTTSGWSNFYKVGIWTEMKKNWKKSVKKNYRHPCSELGSAKLFQKVRRKYTKRHFANDQVEFYWNDSIVKL